MEGARQRQQTGEENEMYGMAEDGVLQQHEEYGREMVVERPTASYPLPRRYEGRLRERWRAKLQRPGRPGDLHHERPGRQGQEQPHRQRKRRGGPRWGHAGKVARPRWHK